jgi:hypothetical protein
MVPILILSVDCYMASINLCKVCKSMVPVNFNLKFVSLWHL